ncbi:hypothetical protein LDENG_00154870 [Lucifuga dentata]|nr:hypothetical protein LDENG_00154870 [Lucifuga dentata]
MSWRFAHGGKILIVPLDGSHWVNMDILIKALHFQNHSVTVIRTSKSWYISDSPYYNTITVQVTEGFDVDFVNPILKKLIALERGENSVMTFASLQLEMFTTMFNIHRLVCQMATNIFKDEDLMDFLKESKYDLVLTDPAWGAGIMLAHYLKIPLIYNVRWVTSGEGHLAIAPSPLSYVPMTGSKLSDKMTFVQRVQNLLFYLIWQTQDILVIHHQYQAVCGADLWLMRADFVFEFPRPTMPNVVYMGGFQCKENDLLGHPKVKLFVAHGGTNGLQEAIYHGVPVVGLPVFFDQHDNLLRLKERGAAKVLTLNIVDKDNNFFKAIQEVLQEPSYRMNMRRLSRLHRDQPMKPLDSTLFWIEFVVRHKVLQNALVFLPLCRCGCILAWSCVPHVFNCFHVHKVFVHCNT